MEQVEKHEFWLKDYPEISQGNDVYRVALGTLIDSTERETFKPRWGNSDLNTQSGSIGFMDVAVREHRLPKEIDDGNGSNYEVINALTILLVGIEPQYRVGGILEY